MDSESVAKFSMVFLLLLIFTGISIGASISDNFETLEYDKEHDITIYCSGSDCPYNERLSKQIRVEACKNQFEISHNSGSEYSTTFRIPVDNDWVGDKDLDCTVGHQSYNVYDPELRSSDTFLGGGNFKVSYSHGELSGGLLALTAEHQAIGTKWKLENWQIYNGGAFSGSNGEIRVKEPDVGGDDVKYREAATGIILSDRNTGLGWVNQVRDMMINPLGNSQGFGAYEVSELELEQNVDSGCDGNCPMGKLNNGDSAKFDLRGEIVVGKEFDPQEGYDEWPSGNVPKDEKRFHLCDSSVDGIHNIEGRTVYSPGPNFEVNAFECHNSEWIERPKCLPEEEWTNEDGSWECKEKNPSLIQTDFLNIEDIPYSKLTSEFIGGFKIPGDQLSKFESHFDGSKLQRVQAECWMGNNNNRPADEAKRGEISVDADSYRENNVRPSDYSDMWILPKIPYRDDVNNNTYSCIWGFDGVYGKYDNQGLFQAVNDFSMKSGDFDKVNKNYRELQDIYDSNNGAYDPNIHWAWDTVGLVDDRGYGEDSPNPFKSPNNEHPYCPGPPAGNNVECGGSSGGTNNKPSSSFSFSPSSPVETGETVDFDGGSSGDTDGSIVSYEWNMGDGTTKSGSSISHSYSSTGTYDVSLTVEDDDGATDTETSSLDVESSVGTGEQFEVAYLPAHFEGEGSTYTEAVDNSHSWLEANLPVDSDRVDKIVVQPSECDVDCTIMGSNQCIDEVDQCVGPSKPIQASDYNKVHVICDNTDPDGSWNGDCGENGQPDAGGLAYLGGAEGSTVFYGSGTTATTVTHEIGHNLDLSHIFNEEMLKDGYSFGDIYDPNNENPTINECGLPPQYKEDAGSGDKELVDWNGYSSGFPNEPDKDEGSDALNFYMTYCDLRIEYGPSATNHMENNQLSDYQ